ncbi:hypothetical protein KP509_38G048300 [Ceratopteris richardii]|nr:hypothetical protein KP509_38G048300 [Ceratopteris richardii]
MAEVRVSPELVTKAVASLFKWERSRKQSRDKMLLLEDDKLLYLVVALKKASPDQNRTNPYQIPLPHPLFMLGDGATQEICLFIDDRKGTKKKEAKQKLVEEGIAIAKVIPLSKLRTDYKSFEAKRKLCGSYDLFLADKSVLPALPRVLGKIFFKKKKHPIPVDLRKKDWKKQIESACGSTFLYIKGGTCSVVKVGRLSQSQEEVCENVHAVISGVASHIPKKWKNIKSLYLKTLESVPLPLYQILPDFPIKIGAE